MGNNANSVQLGSKIRGLLKAEEGGLHYKDLELELEAEAGPS